MDVQDQNDTLMETQPYIVPTDGLILDGKNKYSVTCVRCSSKILNPGVGEYKEIPFDLPNMVHPKNESDPEYNTNLNQYWQVNDKFAFENVGFSNSISGSGIKYLTCADCEIGPIGWYDPDVQLSYVALARIKHLM